MYRFITLFFFVVCVACAVAAQSPLNPPKFIPVQIPGSVRTIVSGINNSAVMVGEYDNPQTHGFAIIGKRALTIDVPPAMGTDTVCNAINSSGEIVGGYSKLGGTSRGFFYANGQFTDIGPSGSEAFATGVNDSGLIVGGYGRPGFGFLWDGVTYQTISVPGSVSTIAVGINNSGVIALNWVDSNNQTHSSLYDGSNYTSVDVPGATTTIANGINNNGDVAITWLDSRNVQHGAILRDGQYHNFMVPGSSRTATDGINDQDVVVGYSWAANVDTGYKLVP